MNFRYGLLALLFLGACSAPKGSLIVKQFQLRDQVRVSDEEPMVRMEKLRRLHGAVSMEERRGRLGQYYTLLWQDEAVDHGEVELVFEYQQGNTGSLVKKSVRKFPSTETSGTTEFSIIGDNYFKNGKVLAWKATLMRGGRVITSKQSYLWQ